MNTAPALLDLPGRHPSGPLDPIVQAMGFMGDMVIHAVLDLPQGVDAALIARALDCVARQQPVLAGSFCPGNLRSHWTVHPRPSWEILETTVEGPDQAARILDQSLDTPYPLERPLPLDLHLLRMPDRDRIIFRVSHLLSDGGGTKRLLWALSSAIQRLRQDSDWLPPQNPFESRQPWRIAGALSLSRLPRWVMAYLRETGELLTPTYLHIPMGADLQRKRALTLRISAERASALIQAWRPEGITVNDLLVAAITRGLERCFGQDSGRSVGLISTSDLRNLIPPEERLCNLSNIRALFVGTVPLPSPHAHLMEVRRRTMLWKEGGRSLISSLIGSLFSFTLPCVLSRPVVELAIRAACERSGGLQTAMTNMGNMSSKLIDLGTGPALDGWMIPPVAGPPFLISGASGCAGNLHWTVPFFEPALSEGLMRALIDAVDDELRLLER